MTSNFDFTPFKTTFFEEINRIRAEHGAPPLVYSSKLETSAMEKAKHLLSNDKLAPHHELRGTNDIALQLITNMDINPLVFTNNIKENSNEYDFAEGKYVERAGGFTQLVWVNTKEVGIGYSSLGEKWCFVLTFFPYGNIEGKFLENVKPFGSQMTQRTAQEPFPLKENPTAEEIKKFFLTAHNTIRERYGCRPFVWDEELAKTATHAAESVVDSKLKSNEKPKLPQEYSQNVLVCGDGIPPMELVMTKWYETRKKFNYETCECSDENGPFVIMLNKATNKIGVGVFTKDKYTCYVALYDPRLVLSESFASEFPKPVGEVDVEFHEQI